MQQTTNTVLMVRPAHFGYNVQTAESNAFQEPLEGENDKTVEQQAVEEFNELVAKLQASGIQVMVMQDSDAPKKPDAIFPNNWISTHGDGTIVTYPMFAPIRRLERREEIVHALQEAFWVKKRIHLENYEAEQLFLEGTGSMILDRVNRLAYACVSARTNLDLLDRFCELMNYEKVAFKAVDANGQEIYHTNVMMALGETFVVICWDTIKNPNERMLLHQKFQETGKEIVEISLEQMLHFAGNMLQVRNEAGERFLVMSEQAYQSLTKAQIEQLTNHTHLIYSPLNTIEKYGGGSARCMIAEIFLPEKS